ncbi:placenta-specific protein 8 [Brachionus plicatilis]|uniref:Placenta-specific protein 8 n=1 Tax=Brachionus plicatilis TaxID=10195 RepID=A0A3M7SQA0_BRAPC|nr:placenta-specific protein 8 [Brachionus plicatilis]
MSKQERVKSAQPNMEVWEFENHWSRDMSDCCTDCGTCCFALFCPMCFLGQLFMRTNECCCMWCIPGGLMSLRSKLRTGFRIRGSLCHDFMATSCCPICAALQIKHELDKQEL